MKIYTTQITSELRPLINSATDVLSIDEERIINSINNQEVKKNTLVSKVLKRYFLSLHCDGKVSPADWSFKTSACQKPKLDHTSHDKPNLFFNVSHCEDVFAMAISSKDEVGLDIESYRFKIDDNLAQTVFTDSQIVKWQGTSTLSKQMHYLRLWTIKEAYAKYLGLGIGLDFIGIDVIGRSESYYAAFCNKVVQPNLIYNETIYFSGKSYALSVTHKGINPNQNPHIIEFDSRSLMKLLSK